MHVWNKARIQKWTLIIMIRQDNVWYLTIAVVNFKVNDYSLWTTLSILEESSLFLCIRGFGGNKAYSNPLIQRNKELSSIEL